MATVAPSVSPGYRPIATPIKLVLIGTILALFEGIYDVLNAELYSGVVDGIEVTTTDIILVTVIAMAVAVVMLRYAYAVRYTPTKRAYLVLGVLGIVTTLVGGLFTVLLALLGAILGYWETRRPPVA